MRLFPQTTKPIYYYFTIILHSYFIIILFLRFSYVLRYILHFPHISLYSYRAKPRNAKFRPFPPPPLCRPLRCSSSPLRARLTPSAPHLRALRVVCASAFLVRALRHRALQGLKRATGRCSAFCGGAPPPSLADTAARYSRGRQYAPPPPPPPLWASRRYKLPPRKFFYFFIFHSSAFLFFFFPNRPYFPYPRLLF